MTWSEWKPLETPCGHATPAVYEVRMTDANGVAISIPRFLRNDDCGLLAIGHTSNMKTRRKKFFDSLKGSPGHSASMLLYRLYRHTPLNTRFPNHQLEYRFRDEAGKNAAEAAESRLFKAYIREFGEVPPLNSNFPDRYEGW